MQTPKARTSSSEVPRKPSPQASSPEVPQKTSLRTVSSEGQPKVSPRVVRQLKVTVHDFDSAIPKKTCRTPKDKSPKVNERRVQRSPKKRPSRITELESQISQLQGDLKKVNEQLISSESWRKQAQENAEESKKQLLAMTVELNESQKHVSKPCSASEETVQTEVHQSAPEKKNENLVFEVEIIKEQHSEEPVTLVTAVNEIEKLKHQLEMVVESEASRTKYTELAQSELHSLKENLAETLILMGGVKGQLRDCKESEAHAKTIVSETLIQLEIAKRTIETLRSEGMKSTEAFNAITSELQQSRSHVNALQDLVNKFKAFEGNAVSSDSQTLAIEALDSGIDKGEMSGSLQQESRNGMREKMDTVKSEVGQLRAALEAAQIKHSEELHKTAEEMRSADELMEQLKVTSSQRENELETELKKSRMDIEHLKANLMDKETEVQGLCEENECLNRKLKSLLSGQGEHELEKLPEKTKAEIENLKAGLMDKETELQNIREENEMLKSGGGTNKKGLNLGKTDKDIEAEVEAARAAEREALTKVGYMKEQVDKSNAKSILVAEQLDAAQAANAELEAELRRLIVQADQWRKAAETAATMLSSGNNGKYVDRTGSMRSPPEDVDNEDLLKRKNPNMLKKIGVLWKKPK